MNRISDVNYYEFFKLSFVQNLLIKPRYSPINK